MARQKCVERESHTKFSPLSLHAIALWYKIKLNEIFFLNTFNLQNLIFWKILSLYLNVKIIFLSNLRIKRLNLRNWFLLFCVERFSATTFYYSRRLSRFVFSRQMLRRSQCPEKVPPRWGGNGPLNEAFHWLLRWASANQNASNKSFCHNWFPLWA